MLRFLEFWRDESGQGLTEYAVLISILALALVAVITPFRLAIIQVFTQVTQFLSSH